MTTPSGCLSLQRDLHTRIGRLAGEDGHLNVREAEMVINSDSKN